VGGCAVLLVFRLVGGTAAPAEPVAGGAEPAASATPQVDAALEGMREMELVVDLADGRRVIGTLWAVQPSRFTLVDRADGRVLVVDKAAVRSIHVNLDDPALRTSGAGLRVGGGVALGLGIPVLLTGIIMVAVCPDCTEVNAPLLALGIAATGAGTTMVVVGARRKARFDAALRRRGPLARLRWTGGLGVRF
jgi:hypothetical protein